VILLHRRPRLNRNRQIRQARACGIEVLVGGGKG
jgi:hypothetical protein